MATSNTAGFKDVNSAVGTQEYQYDSNGNMTSDANKGITNIEYNYLNLPEQVTLDNGDIIHYTYDAAGIKHAKTVDDGSPETTAYVGGFHYLNGDLNFLQHAEGLALKSGTTWNYEYNLTDHLGNVRVSVNASGDVVQRDGYYPFGLTFNSWTGGDKNNYLYNQGFGETTFQGEEGKVFRGERQQELDVDMTKYRTYDYAIGRFWQVDPAADMVGQESWTPYHYTFNNPLRYNDPYGDCVGELPCPQSLKNIGEGFSAVGGALGRSAPGQTVKALGNAVLDGVSAVSDGIVSVFSSAGEAMEGTVPNIYDGNDTGGQPIVTGTDLKNNPDLPNAPNAEPPVMFDELFDKQIAGSPANVPLKVMASGLEPSEMLVEALISGGAPEAVNDTIDVQSETFDSPSGAPFTTISTFTIVTPKGDTVRTTETEINN